MYESLILFTILHIICLCGSTYLPTIMCNGEMSLLRGIIFYDIVLRKIFTLFYWERLKTFWFWNMQNSPVHLLHVVLKSLYSRWIIVMEKFFFYFENISFCRVKIHTRCTIQFIGENDIDFWSMVSYYVNEKFKL